MALSDAQAVAYVNSNQQKSWPDINAYLTANGRNPAEVSALRDRYTAVQNQSQNPANIANHPDLQLWQDVNNILNPPAAAPSYAPTDALMKGTAPSGLPPLAPGQTSEATKFNTVTALAPDARVTAPGVRSDVVTPGAYNTMEELWKANGITPAPNVAPTTPASTPVTQKSIYSGAAGYTGPSIVDFLSAAGQPNDFTSRTALATKYGITGYTGTAAQNTQLLNVLKAQASGAVNANGVPTNIGSTLGVGSAPTPAAPIPSTGLGTDTSGIGKALGSNLPTSTDSDIAGLLALYGASTESSKQYDELSTKLTEIMGSLGNEGADLQAAMDAQGVGANFDKVKSLNLDAARLKGELDKFDAESVALNAQIENQTIPQAIIVGQQAELQKQRDITKLAKAAELSATLALSQAYQGNADMGMQLAQKAVDMKYQPLLNQIDVLKTQLGFAKDKMTREDSARANIIGNLLDIKKSELATEKDQQSAIQNMAIQAATNGAPISVVNAIRNAADPVSAAVAGAGFINPKKTTPTGAGTGTGGRKGTGKTVFTQTQLNQGAANSGIPIAQFANLSDDSKNYYINSFSKFNSILNDIRAGKEDASAVINEVQSSNLPDDVKANLVQKIKAIAPTSSADANPLSPGSLFSNAVGAVSTVWSQLKGLFGL
jgi:hypothetical protein